MKKRLIFVGVLTLLLFAVLCKQMPRDVVEIAARDSADIYIYCRYFDGEYLKNGSGCIARTNKEKYRTDKIKAKEISGVSFSFSGNTEDAKAVARELKLTVTSFETVCGIMCIYGFSPLVAGGIYADGDKINVQIAYFDGKITVGSPLILGGY